MQNNNFNPDQLNKFKYTNLLNNHNRNKSNGTNVTTDLHNSVSTLSHDIPNENITNITNLKNNSNSKNTSTPPFIIDKYDYMGK